MLVCLPKSACRHLNALTRTQVQSKKDLKIGIQKTNTVTAPTVEQVGSPLYNLDIIPDNLAKLGTNIKHGWTTCID